MNIMNSSVFNKLLSPITLFMSKNKFCRLCSKLDDVSWINIGIMRTLSKSFSGRDFLQDFSTLCNEKLPVSHFFETLKSKRRLNFVMQTNRDFVNSMKDKPIADPFAEIEELDDFDIYAGDGHTHGAPVHEQKISGKVYPNQNFYSINSRTQMMTLLTTAMYGSGRKKEHDMHALKRKSLDELRQCAPRGRKVLYVWDAAGIDFFAWNKWKKAGGLYFLSVEQKHHRLLTIGQSCFNKDDPINNGVICDEMASSANGDNIRRVVYSCPLSGKNFTFLTNLPYTIRPGIVAYLYMQRWDIEKSFNTFKHKLYEKKAWAKSETAKSMQANFLCLAHNLSVILNARLQTEGVDDNRDIQRQKERLSAGKRKAEKKGLKVNPLIIRVLRVTELPQIFYRWLRAFIHKETSWREAISTLKSMQALF